jgi:hypothetical protein
MESLVRLMDFLVVEVERERSLGVLLGIGWDIGTNSGLCSGEAARMGEDG